MQPESSRPVASKVAASRNAPKAQAASEPRRPALHLAETATGKVQGQDWTRWLREHTR